MSKLLWQNLADFLNLADISPYGGSLSEPPFPAELYNASGTWGISYKPNGGNHRWFVVAGPNLPTIEHYNQ